MGKGLRLGLITLSGLLLLMAALLIMRGNSLLVYADSSDLRPNFSPSLNTITPTLTATGDVTATHAIPPPEGYPKLDQSVKTVTPTLASTGGVTLYYGIEIRNTGAWTATNGTLTDYIPDGTTYNNDAQVSDGSTLTYTNGTLTWAGVVGFDSTVVMSFSVAVASTFNGTVRNTAVISDPLMTEPVTVTAETIVTDNPILVIGKTSAPAKPGPNKPLTYTIIITNQGQPATNLPITVTDWVPLSTTLRSIGPDGFTSPISDVITWTRYITLELGETSEFTFSVNVDAPSGTVITNADYQVDSLEIGVTTGDVYTVTVVDPILSLFKEVWPDPPGSNREMTYTLTLLNQGSLATGLVITDQVPAGVTYQRGGSEAGGVVSWAWPSLDTGETAQFTFTVYISDVAEVDIVNSDYVVCSAEGICQPGNVLTSVVKGPTFEVVAIMDPIAKKPGGGSDPSLLVTPTLTIRNLGPGNAISATVLLVFEYISIDDTVLIRVPAIGPPPSLWPYFKCGPKCDQYTWVGDLAHGEAITFTTTGGQSTQVGEEGTIYTATAIVTDSLSNMITEPVSDTATGKITHLANLVPIKSALPVVGPGQLLTYTITVVNTGLSTEDPPYPVLTDTVPVSVTVVSVSDLGVTQTLTDTTVVSWTLPAMSTGEILTRSFTVRVDGNLVSGTQIVNNDYGTTWYESDVQGITGTVVFSNTGQPVTTTVREVGLIHSYKEVTPTAVLPGGVLTYYVHIVNTSGIALNGVTAEDLAPWQFSTYQVDAVASGGTIYEEDIVSVHWMGDVAPFSSEVITFSVVANLGYEGLITNTVVISHPDLLSEIERQAVAYVTDEPVLRITKSASPDPVDKGAELRYTIQVEALGLQATALVITDTIPEGTTYVPGSATSGGQLVGDQVQWQIGKLEPNESSTFEFRVTVNDGSQVTNDQYTVTSAEGVVGVGDRVVTRIRGGGGVGGDVYLPIILKNY